jgi:hypothetical protein
MCTSILLAGERQKKRTRFFLAAVSLLWTAGFAYCDEKTLNVRDSERRIFTAKSSAYAGALVKDLLKATQGKALTPPPRGEGFTLALFDAWERQINSSDTKQTRSPERFLGFVEGRLGLHAPSFWEESVIARYVEQHPDESAQYRELQSKYRKDNSDQRLEKRTIQGHELRTSATVRVDEKGTATIFGEGQKKTLVKSRLLQEIFAEFPSVNRLEILIGESDSFVCAFDHFAAHYPLICIATKTGELRWRTVVWAMGSEIVPFRSGIWTHKAVILHDSACVAVFGTGSYGTCYCELFSLEDGRPYGKFASNYWYGDLVK